MAKRTPLRSSTMVVPKRFSGVRAPHTGDSDDFPYGKVYAPNRAYTPPLLKKKIVGLFERCSLYLLMCIVNTLPLFRAHDLCSCSFCLLFVMLNDIRSFPFCDNIIYSIFPFGIYNKYLNLNLE